MENNLIEVEQAALLRSFLDDVAKLKDEQLRDRVIQLQGDFKKIGKSSVPGETTKNLIANIKNLRKERKV